MAAQTLCRQALSGSVGRQAGWKTLAGFKATLTGIDMRRPHQIRLRTSRRVSNPWVRQQPADTALIPSNDI